MSKPDQIDTIIKDGQHEAREEVVRLKNVKVEYDNTDGKINIFINGKRPVWCRQVDLSITVEGTDATLYRFLVKGEHDEEFYWAAKDE